MSVSHKVESLSLADRKDRSGLHLKIAQSDADLEACQALRFKVFYQDGGAKAPAGKLAGQLDADGFDPICDHLMVNDGEDTIGTYRLLRQDRLGSGHTFYSQHEFDVGPMLERHEKLRFLELGRSCVLSEYRTRGVIELLWQGIWDYVRHHRLDVMFGCASLPGIDIGALAPQLAYLGQFHKAPSQWQVSAHENLRVDPVQIAAGNLNPRQILRDIPPLIKGYLRLGAYIGDGAVIDAQFNTTDVLIILPVSAISPRYFTRFGAPDGKPQPLMS